MVQQRLLIKFQYILTAIRLTCSSQPESSPTGSGSLVVWRHVFVLKKEKDLPLYNMKGCGICLGQPRAVS